MDELQSILNKYQVNPSTIKNPRDTDTAGAIDAWGAYESDITSTTNKKEASGLGKLGKTASDIASFVGGEKIAQGIASTINTNRATKIQEDVSSISDPIITNAIKLIQEKRARGEDTSRLEQSLATSQQGLGEIQTLIQDEIDTMPTAGQVIGSAAQLATLAVPMVKAPLLTKTAGGAATGYASDVATNLAEGVEAPFSPGVGTVVGASLPVAGAVAKQTANTAKNLLRYGGEKVTGIGIRPLTREAGLVQSYEAATPLAKRTSDVFQGTRKSPQTAAKTAVERGIVGRGKDIGVFAQRESKKVYNDVINPALKGLDDSGQVFTKDKLFSKAEELVQKEADPTRQEALSDALEAVKEDYRNIENWTYSDIENLKQSLNERVPEKMYRGKNVTNEATVIRKKMADAIREDIYSKLGQDVRNQYLDYGNLQQLKELGIKSRTQSGLRGGAGSFISTLIDQAVIPISTISGRTLYRIGDTIEFIAQPGKNYKYAEDVINAFLEAGGKTAIRAGSVDSTKRKIDAK